MVTIKNVNLFKSIYLFLKYLFLKRIFPYKPTTTVLLLARLLRLRELEKEKVYFFILYKNLSLYKGFIISNTSFKDIEFLISRK